MTFQVSTYCHSYVSHALTMWPPKKKMLAPTLNDCSGLKKRKQQAATQEVECLVCPSSCCWSTVTDWLKVWLEFRDPPGKKNTQTQHIDSTRPGDPTQPGVGLGWVGLVQFCIRLTLAGDVAQEVSLSNKLFLLLCSCVHAALQSSIELSFHNLPTLLFFSQHDGLLFSLSVSHLSSNAGTLSLPLIYHFLLPLSSLSLAISLPVRLCSPLSDFLSGSVTLILFLLSSSSSSSLPLPEDLPLPSSPPPPPAQHQSLHRRPVPSRTCTPHARHLLIHIPPVSVSLELPEGIKSTFKFIFIFLFPLWLKVFSFLYFSPRRIVCLAK